MSDPLPSSRAASPWVAVLERLPRLLAIAVAAAVVVGGASLLQPRRYEASVTVATVSGSRMPAGLSSLAGLSGLNLSTGLTVTPELVAGLAVSRRVLLAVADTVDAAGPLAPRLAEEELPSEWVVERAVRRRVSASPDRRTGLVTLRVADRDSALARVMANRLVAVLSATYVDVARSQAAAQRRGQEARVDSMAAALTRAERSQLEFLRSNRGLSPEAEGTLERQRLERALSIATQTFQQAVLEREAAVARELEQTPIVVVVDPLPATLRPMPRYTTLYALFAAIVAGVAAASLLLFQEWMRPRGAAPTPEAARLAMALQQWPLLRRLTD
jgi:uncharacterized protein involved in exopolysaccharide biosynthesis